MKLGIIIDPTEQGFAYAHKFGLETGEFCYNVDHDAIALLAQAEDLKRWSAQYGVQVASIGRWGAERVRADGTFTEEQAQDFALIDLAAALGCPSFVCGLNPVEGMEFEENAHLGASYFRSLIAYAQGKNVRVNVYNCDWNNIIYDKRGWDIVLKEAPGLGIKYDPSHCINRDGDYLAEMMEYGEYIGHFHVKGTLRINGDNIPDPPAGMDNIHWGAIMAILYTVDYQGMLSIEPHSAVWREGPLADFGVRFTANMMRGYLMPA